MSINSAHIDDRIQFTRIGDVVSKYDPNSAWFEVIINDGRNRVALISSPPGTPPDPHIHADYNEWWISVGGKTQWQIGQYEPVVAGWGDVVVAPAGYCHDIRPKGTSPGIRLVATHPNSNHDIRGISPSRYVPVEYETQLPNLIHTRFDWLRKKLGTEKSWSQPIVNDNRNLVQIIQDLATSGHVVERETLGDEWWIMLEGTASLETGQGPKLQLKTGDITLLESGTHYQIRTTGNKPSVRILVSAQT